MTAPLHAVKYGKETIRFRVAFSSRKTLAIDVHPDLSIAITAPQGTALEDIKRIVRKRAAWIIRQRNYFSQFLPPEPPRRFVSGESHYYLGRQYRLKVVESKEESVKLKGGWIFIAVRAKSETERVEVLLSEWMRERARERFRLSIENCARRMRIAAPPFQIRKMAKRWGSCTSRGVIYLNPGLIKAPSHCIDYVVTHELCHLKYQNHGKAFYALLGRAMPDWEMRKMRLERVRY